MQRMQRMQRCGTGVGAMVGARLTRPHLAALLRSDDRAVLSCFLSIPSSCAAALAARRSTDTVNAAWIASFSAAFSSA